MDSQSTHGGLSYTHLHGDNMQLAELSMQPEPGYVEWVLCYIAKAVQLCTYHGIAYNLRPYAFQHRYIVHTYTAENPMVPTIR